MTYSPFRHLGSVFIKGRPIQLTFFLTRKCNARCRFCFYLSRRQETREKEPELTLDEIEKAASSLGSLVWLAFSGGEIFLRDDLPEIASLFYRRNKPSIILLPTNGLLPDRIEEMTERILKSCPRSTIVVKLSLDGTGDVHDSLRGVPGAFRSVLESGRRLAALSGRHQNLEVGINTVFCAANQQQMPELIRLVAGLKGIRTHTVSLIRGTVADPGLMEVDHQAYADTAGLLESNLKTKLAPRYGFFGARLKAAQDILQRRLIADTFREKKRQIPCYAGKLTLVLTETGDVYACESFDRRIGSIRDYGCDVKNLLKSRWAREVARSIAQGGCCCTHECYMMMNILFNPALYPGLIREYLGMNGFQNAEWGLRNAQCGLRK